MKYSFVALALTGAVYASSSDTAKDIASSVQSIADAVNKFDAAIKAYGGGSAEALISASKAIGAATTTANAKIGADDPLILTDALGIQQVVTGLQGNIEAAMSDLVAAKSKLVAGNQGCLIQKELDAQGTSASSLQKTITSKIPSDVQAIAAKLSGGITEAINKGVDAYKDACTGGASSSVATGSSGSGSSSSGSGSSGSHSSSGSGSGAGSGSSAGHSGSGSTGSSSSPGSTTSTGPKPAIYTGAASALNAPALLAIGMAMLAL